MKNIKLSRGKNCLLLRFDNKLIYSQKFLSIQNSNKKLSSNSNVYLTMMVYMKRLGIKN